MKKLLSLIFVFLCFVSVNANDIKYIANDNVDTEGWRTISSEFGNLYTNWTTAASSALTVTVSPTGDVTYFLKICFNEGKLTMDQGSALLLKLGDGSTIELKSNYIGPSDYTYRVTKHGTNYYVYPVYEITPEQIQEIIDKDVIKMRVQWTGGIFDKDIKKNKLSKHLTKVYPAIQSALSQQRSIYDDF